MSSCGCRKEYLSNRCKCLKTISSTPNYAKAWKKKDVVKDIFYIESDNYE